MSLISDLKHKIERWQSSWRELRPLWQYGVIGSRQKRTLTNVTFYATNRCDSRCLHCGIWQQRPVVHLPLDIFQQVRDSPATDAETNFGFEGGEFLLHPQCDEILELFEGRRIELYTNGLKPDRVEQLIDRHKIPHVILSLEGKRETYRKLRGVDGFDRVIGLVDSLMGRTKVSISCTLTPWNTLEDFLFVRDFCRERGITFGINIMHAGEFFDRDCPLEPISYAQRENLPNEHPVKEDYFLLYNEWLKGSILLPCTSIFHRIVVYPDGEIPLCQQGHTGLLGNLKEQRLEDIWWSARTLKMQKEHIRCNSCWISFHRYDDLFIQRALRTFLPHCLIDFYMRHGKRAIPQTELKQLEKYTKGSLKEKHR